MNVLCARRDAYAYPLGGWAPGVRA